MNTVKYTNSERPFRWLVLGVALAFTVFFVFTIIPALLVDKDVFGAFAAGFVNPYAAGYSIDVIACWLILAIWVIHERLTLGIRHGWLCLILGVVPGVAVGFAVYLCIRKPASLPRFSAANPTNEH